MKTMTSTRFPFTLTLKRSGTLAKVIVAGVVAFTLLNCPAVRGATLLSKAPNAAVYFGLPFAGLEFENLLTGGERVLGHKVLEWRDADYAKPGHPLYDDWNATASVTGNANELYLWSAADSAWTATTVPSTTVSIHLNSDDNDGLAEVLVDGVQVAKFDMNTVPCCQTVLIVVKGLSNTTHTITVNDLGWGIGGDDTHVMGAAALKENDIKWNQPPDPAHPTNIFYGWNEQSVESATNWAADDWVCTNAAPVTKIRWWGSFLNWTETNIPARPWGFSIKFWTDVKKGDDPLFPGFSHPGNPLKNITCTNFTVDFVGWDFDPRSNTYEACFLFEQTLATNDWFYQTNGPTGTNIYWISIGAMQPTGELYPWGWKTRPRDTNSLAPDDAVRFAPWVPWYQPLYWPTTNDSWDLAFELISGETVAGGTKWEQLPDLSYYGMNVNASTNMPPQTPYLLADDFRCTSPGYITNITIWGSWTNDMLPGQSPVSPSNVIFTLSIHSDIPAYGDPWNYPYSMPGTNLWTNIFPKGTFTCTMVITNNPEYWLTPPDNSTPSGDRACYRYDFQIDPTNAFYQTGTPTQPRIYWLDVQARPGYPNPVGTPKFGWKTSITNWNDDAVWANAIEVYNGIWQKLTYPWNHTNYGHTVDLAFRLNFSEVQTNEVKKWSQPPVPYNPPDAFNGWNQGSGGNYPVVADDWACTNDAPVTDIHWWGSFIGWTEPYLPQLPDAFMIDFWSDVPADPGMPGSFSYPGAPIWSIHCTNFTTRFVGWDWDPRNPGMGPEACFKFEQDLCANEWFPQSAFGTQPTNVFWISIAAVYNTTPTYPFGWKTRPHDTNSLAPDDAVIRNDLVNPPWQPIYYPDPTNSWDMAFELTTAEQGNCIQVVCSTNIVVTCAPTNGAVVTFQSYATNFCTGAVLTNVTCVPPSGSLFPVGVTQVCCTNITPPWTNYCCFTVTVLTDTTPPSITCSTNIVANTDPGQCSKSNVTFVVTAVDDCDPNPVIVCNPTNGSTFPKGTNTVNCTATDAAGNSTNCSFTVTIRDLELPSVSCPSNIVANTDPGLCSKSNVTWVATATDNCPDVVTNCNPPSGSTFAKGTNTVRCTATDSSGNTNSCSFTVTIYDVEPPSVHCPSNIVATADPGHSSKSNVTWVATATDNCPDVVTNCNPPSGSTFPFGTNTVCCTATDASGNTNSCCFTVTICWPKPTTNIVITNIVFTSKFNGWNEPSVLGGTNTVAADDWVCTTTNPVTDIRWWGSFLGWHSNTPPRLPDAFQIAFWSDVPTNAGMPFSYPGAMLKEINCTSATCQFVGWDLDPRTLEYEACFRFDQKLATNEWFYQTNGPTGSNIYWLSIAAVYMQGAPEYVWGWKTRPRAANSPAPDDAVRISNYPQGPYEPIYWPERTNSWDLAFELISSYTNVIEKWVQPPDLTTTGWDVNDTDYGNPAQACLLADDFGCRMTGPITDITIWGSWRTNLIPPIQIATFTLSIHKDVTNVISMPGPVLWSQSFAPGQYQEQFWGPGMWPQGWFSPGVGFWPNDHFNCFRYDFHIATNAFVQTNDTTYWLDCQALLPPQAPFQFGWKTTMDGMRWHDAAVWANGTEPSHGDWNPLYRPDGPGTTMDLAFAVYTSQSFYQLKWSQPPVTNRYLTLEWTWENDIHYQLQGTFALSNAPAHCVWTNVGPEVIGPVHQQSDTNTTAPQRFYRVVAPNVVP